MSGEPTPLAGKRAFITGAAAGIGRALALRLARAGAALFLVDRDEAGLAETRSMAAALGVDAATRVADLSCASAATACADAALVLGPVDILVNCAGITGPRASLLESDEDSWDAVFALNARAPYLLMKRLGRHMADRGGQGREDGGRMVNVTSSSAHRARWSLPAYGASKAALAQLTRSAAADLGPHGITVNAVAPGITATRMVTDNFDEESLAEALRTGPLANFLGRLTEPEDIAEAVLFLCLPASRQITGQTLHVSAGAIT